MTANAEDIEAGIGFVPFYRALVLDQNRDELISYLTTKFGFDKDLAEAMIDQLPELLADDFRTRTDPSDHHLAERAVDAFFGFALLGSIEVGHVPSKFVDFVWEACMLRSHVYFAICEVVVGAYMFHFPWDLKGFGPADKTPLRASGLVATRTALAILGPVDDAVWGDLTLNGCNLCMSDSNGRGRTADAVAPAEAGGTGGQGGDETFCYTSEQGTEVRDGLVIRLGDENRQAWELNSV